MADFSFGFIEGSFSLLNGQKDMRLEAGDLISNKQKRKKNEFIKNGEGTDIIKLSIQYFSTKGLRRGRGALGTQAPSVFYEIIKKMDNSSLKLNPQF